MPTRPVISATAQTGISGWTTSSATAAAAMLSITIGAHL